MPLSGASRQSRTSAMWFPPSLHQQISRLLLQGQVPLLFPPYCRHFSASLPLHWPLLGRGISHVRSGLIALSPSLSSACLRSASAFTGSSRSPSASRRWRWKRQGNVRRGGAKNGRVNGIKERLGNPGLV